MKDFSAVRKRRSLREKVRFGESRGGTPTSQGLAADFNHSSVWNDELRQSVPILKAAPSLLYGRLAELEKSRDFPDGQYFRSALDGARPAGLWLDEDWSTVCFPALRHPRHLSVDR